VEAAHAPRLSLVLMHMAAGDYTLSPGRLPRSLWCVPVSVLKALELFHNITRHAIDADVGSTAIITEVSMAGKRLPAGVHRSRLEFVAPRVVSKVALAGSRSAKDTSCKFEDIAYTCWSHNELSMSFEIGEPHLKL
jgi:hypothetical protein